MKKTLLFLFLLLSITVLGQPYTNSTCATAMQIVSGQNYSYTAWTGNNFAQAGPAYNCLTSQPDPAWFYFMIGASGDIHIYMSSSPCKDIDFCMWGPFTSPAAGCSGGLINANVIDCSYSGICSETMDLTNCSPGQYYIMVITNYSKQACTITFSQTSGSGVMTYFTAPTISSNGPLCEGQNLTLNANAVAGATYNWTGPGGFTSTLQNPVINNITAAQAGTYSCALSLGTNFGPVSTTQVVVNPLPTPAFVANSFICPGTYISIGGPPIAGMTYTWSSSPPGFSSSLSNPSVSPSSNTQYYLAGVLGGCVAHTISNVNLLPLPIAFAGSNNAVCDGSSTNIGTIPIPGYNYSWSSNPPGFSSALSSPFITPTANTNFFLEVTGTNTCVNRDTVEITLLPVPQANTGQNQSICSGDVATIGSAAITGNFYSWTSSPVGYTSSLANPSVSPTVQTIYTLTETSPNTCSKINAVTITVNPKPAAFTIPNQSICTGTVLSIGGPPITGSTYSWSSSPAGLVSTLSNPSVHPGIQTTYTVTEINSFNCSQTHTVTINVNPVPNPVLSANYSTCAGTAIVIGGSPVAGNSYSWSSLPAGFTSSLSNPSVNPSTTTSYTLNQTIVATGCSKTATTTVTVNPLPAALTGPNQTICLGNSVTLGGATVAGSQYYWTSNPSGFTSSVANPTVSPTANTVYILTELKPLTSCLKTNTVTVNILNKPKIQGVIKYDNTVFTGLDSTVVKLIDLPNLVVDSAKTNNSGNYSIKCIEPGYYKVSAHCNKKWGGVNSTDALIIAQYSVGLVPLSNLRKEAADVNQSGYVNALDAYMVMRRYTGQINSFPSGDWLLPTPDSTQIITLNNTINITGLCYGDVNGSFTPPFLNISQKPQHQDAEGTENLQIPMDEAIRINQQTILQHAK